MTNNEKDLRKLQVVAQRINDGHVDITSDHADWINITFACTSLGEEARSSYHLICQQYPGYDHAECDQKFDYCMKTSKQLVSLGTLMSLAKSHGIDTSMPVGRPSQKGEKAEKVNVMEQMKEALNRYAKLRFNIWTNRAEMLDGDKWVPVKDRDRSTFLCRMIEEGIKATDKLLIALLQSKDYVQDFDPFKDYYSHLTPWNPDTDPDYIRDFFVGHIEFGNPEETEFYDTIFKKWFVGMNHLWLGLTDDNPIVPVFCGEQHIGKTYLINRILPPELREYQYNVNPTAKVDKDFVISLSEMAMLFLDEFSFGSDKKSDAYKYAITSSSSYERDSYGHNREHRKRKASLIAATNQKRFIRDPEGSRRYVGIDIVGTKNLSDYPLNYEGAYAQALYLIKNGYNPKPTREDSIAITEHDKDYMEPNDCMEVLRTFYRLPSSDMDIIAISSGEIQQELVAHGFHGGDYKAVNIGKAMKRLGFDTKRTKNGYKYLVSRVDIETLKVEQKQDASEILTPQEQDIPF